MADEKGSDTPVRTEEETSSSGSDSEEEQVEWMVTARQKRSTAGNRLTSLLQQEEPDDELELLFAEADDDAGFEDADNQSDVQMDSSDDDDDQGPAAGADDLEGEQELQQQARIERQARKRKVNDGIPKIFKKRVKIDRTASQALPRPKKKSERVSWIPSPADMPTRASQRGTTKLSKEQLHVQMINREVKRLKQLKTMEKAAAAKSAAKKPPMTQADRLAEAARVEKQNSKSLSRWEEAEQQREEEQRAKLAALSNRQMTGPVITWWSGMAEWVGGRLRKVGKNLEIEEPKEVKHRKRKASEMEDLEAGAPMSLPDGGSPEGSRDQDILVVDRPEKSATPPREPPQQEFTPQPNLELPRILPLPTTMPIPPVPPPYPAFTLAPPIQPSFPLNGTSNFAYPQNQPPRLSPYTNNPFGFAPAYPPPPPARPATPPPPAIEHAAVSYVTFQNFDETAIKSKDVQTQILFNRKFVKMPASKLSAFFY